MQFSSEVRADNTNLEIIVRVVGPDEGAQKNPEKVVLPSKRALDRYFLC